MLITKNFKVDLKVGITYILYLYNKSEYVRITQLENHILK